MILTKLLSISETGISFGYWNPISLVENSVSEDARAFKQLYETINIKNQILHTLQTTKRFVFRFHK